MKMKLIAAPLGAAVLVGSMLIATPALAKNNCGTMIVERTGIGTARVIQTCDKGTQAFYSLSCLVGGNQYSRYYSQGSSAVTKVTCPGGNGNPLRSVSVSFG